jgi:hypothetical protein
MQTNLNQYFIAVLIALFLTKFSPVNGNNDSDSVPTYNKIVSFSVFGKNTYCSLSHTWMLNEVSRGTFFNLDLRYRDKNNSQYIAAEYFLCRGIDFGNHHIYCGLGYAFNLNRTYEYTDLYKNGWYNGSKYTHKFHGSGDITGKIGYIYWNTSKNLYFRAAFQPIFEYQKRNVSLSNSIYSLFEIGLGYAYSNTQKNKTSGSSRTNKHNKIGIESNLGYFQMKLDNTGNAKDLVSSKFLVYTYQPNKLYFKIKFGETSYGYNAIKITNSDIRLFRNNPKFTALGIGIGYSIITYKGWNLCPEFTSGTCFIKKIIFYNQPLQSQNNQYQWEEKIVNYSNTFSFGLQTQKRISQNIDLTLGVQYSYNNIYMANEYSFVLALNYSLW